MDFHLHDDQLLHHLHHGDGGDHVMGRLSQNFQIGPSSLPRSLEYDQKKSKLGDFSFGLFMNLFSREALHLNFT